jgi:hypothetical protein
LTADFDKGDHPSERSTSGGSLSIADFVRLPASTLRRQQKVFPFGPGQTRDGSARGNPIPQRIDLSTATEATRRAVYDAVVAIYFSPTPEASPPSALTRRLTPSSPTRRTRLKVYKEHGNWYVTWMRLEFPEEIPGEFRRELFQVEEEPSARFGIALLEV